MTDPSEPGGAPHDVGGPGSAEPAPGRPGEAAHRPVLSSLLALQDLDLRLQQLRHRRGHLPEQGVLGGIDRAIDDLEASARLLEADRGRLGTDRDVLDGEASTTSARIASIEDRLRSGTAGSYRDQEAMAAEVASLGRRRSEIEDHELAVMEELEPVEAAIENLSRRHGDLEADLAAARVALEEALGVVDAEITATAQQRPLLAAALPPELLAAYGSLANRLDGVAVARVVHGTCDGCRLSLSATEMDQLRHATTALVHCEQCGRILVGGPSTR